MNLTMRPAFPTLLPLLAGLALLAALAGCTQTNIEDELRQGLAKAKDGDYAGALEHTDRCLRISPNSVNALLLHGFCLYSQPSAGGATRASAFRHLEQATKLAPDRFDVWYFYGWSLYENGMSHEAIKPLEKALSMCDPQSRHYGAILMMLGRCCVHNNIQTKALRYLQPLRVREPDRKWPETYNALGMLAVQRGEYQEAIKSFAEAFKLDRQDPAILQNIAVTCDMYLNQPQVAKRYYEQTLERLPAKEVILRQLIQNRLEKLNRK